MKNLLLTLLLVLVVFPVSGVRKVSKIYLYAGSGELYEVQNLTYDEQGRLIQWKETGPDENERWFKHDFNYVDSRHIEITGWSERDDCRMEVTLNDDGFVETALLYVESRGELKPDSKITLSYADGIMIKLVWTDQFNGREDIDDFVIVNGNPVSGWKYGDADVAYTDMPNKIGMAYLPFLTCNSEWLFRSLALAGLEGYGSRNLPYSCWFDKRQPKGVIDYELDADGYVVSMNITNCYDGEGLYKFEYCETGGMEPIPADGSCVKVHAENGTIVVDGQYSTLSVYNLVGSRCGTTDLASGIYVVTVDGTTHKIRVD